MKTQINFIKWKAQTVLAWIRDESLIGRFIKMCQRWKWTSTTIVLAIVSLPFLWFTMTSFIELSLFAMALIKITVGVAIIGVIDTVIFPQIDAIQEIRKGNVAYSVVYGALILFVGIILAAG